MVWLGFCTWEGVLPFPKRTAAPAEEVFLSSEDLEALPSASLAGFLPPAPASPTFGPQSAPYGFSQSSLLNAPAPPHSLAPVAMGSDRSFGGVSATGTNPQSVAAPDRPSYRWGITIAVSGAVVGGLLGLMLRAPSPASVAAATQNITTHAAANSLSAPAAAPLATTAAPAPVTPVVVVPPAAAAPMNDSTGVPPNVIAPPTTQTKAERRAAAKAAAAAALAERADRLAADKAVAAPPPKRPSFVATKVLAPKPAIAPVAVVPKPVPVVVEKAPPPAKMTKADKAAAAAAAKSESADKKAGAGEAREALEDARRDTTNTL